jgi:hypothetical protein
MQEAERIRDGCCEMAALALESWRSMRNNAATHHEPTTAVMRRSVNDRLDDQAFSSLIAGCLALR